MYIIEYYSINKIFKNARCSRGIHVQLQFAETGCPFCLPPFHFFPIPLSHPSLYTKSKILFAGVGATARQIRSRWILEMNDGRAGTRVVATIHARVYRCVARTQARGIVALVPPLNRCGVGESKPEEKRSGSGRAARLLVYSGVQGGWEGNVVAVRSRIGRRQIAVLLRARWPSL